MEISSVGENGSLIIYYIIDSSWNPSSKCVLPAPPPDLQGEVGNSSFSASFIQITCMCKKIFF